MKKKVVLYIAGIILIGLAILSFLPIYTYREWGLCPGDDPINAIAGAVYCKGNLWQGDVPIGAAPGEMKIWIIANILVSLTVVVSAIAAIINPHRTNNESTGGKKFYLKGAILLSALALFMPIMFLEPGISLLLFTVAIAQIVNSILGIRRHEKTVAIVLMIAALFYILLGVAFSMLWTRGFFV
ncbi:hypothetical protein FWG95_02895 [Candidatus Saccharibacteria bacterium]|nr:hypothetical protein [Candidatus Saccharibacteria bacterium]